MELSLIAHFEWSQPTSWFTSGTFHSQIRTLLLTPTMSNHASDSSNTTRNWWAPSHLSWTISNPYSADSCLALTSVPPARNLSKVLQNSWLLPSLMATHSNRSTNIILTIPNGTAAYRSANNKHSHVPPETLATLEHSNLTDAWNPLHTTSLLTSMSIWSQTKFTGYSKKLLPALRQSTYYLANPICPSNWTLSPLTNWRKWLSANPCTSLNLLATLGAWTIRPLSNYTMNSPLQVGTTLEYVPPAGIKSLTGKLGHSAFTTLWLQLLLLDLMHWSHNISSCTTITYPSPTN